MKKDDTCYYMSITKEENSAFVVNQNQTTPDQPKEGKRFSQTNEGREGESKDEEIEK